MKDTLTALNVLDSSRANTTTKCEKKDAGTSKSFKFYVMKVVN